MSNEGPLELREILRIGLQVAKGLAAAHSQGLVHRDIKPANIFLDEGVERVQLMDFGLARAVDDASLTRSGVLAGTPQYMSPEQARAEKVDHQSDLFSLGSVLYAMCVGHAPFRAESSYSVLRLITDKEPRPIREINSDIPEWLCAIIGKLMSKQPEDRFDSAEQVAELLEDCLAHVQEPTTTPLPAPVAELAKSFDSRTANATESFGGFRFPTIGKLIGSAAFTFFLIAGTIFFLESRKGTIRIETNSEVEIPIVIRQADKVVEHLTVSKDGATSRLKAGNYVIDVEADDAKFAIKGANVTITRGKTWVATISQVPGDTRTASSDEVAMLDASKTPANAKELLHAMQGEWSFTKWVDNGKERKLSQSVKATADVEGATMTLNLPFQKSRNVQLEVVGPHASLPNTFEVDFSSVDGGDIDVRQGLVQCDKGLLRVCFATNRPNRFIRGTHVTLWEAARIDSEPAEENYVSLRRVAPKSDVFKLRVPPGVSYDLHVGLCAPEDADHLSFPRPAKTISIRKSPNASPLETVLTFSVSPDTEGKQVVNASVVDHGAMQLVIPEGKPLQQKDDLGAGYSTLETDEPATYLPIETIELMKWRDRSTNRAVLLWLEPSLTRFTGNEVTTVQKERASCSGQLAEARKNFGPRHPETVQLRKRLNQLDRLLGALNSFKYPKNGKNGITVWRQATPRSGRFSTVHNDDAITLFDAIDSFEDRCAPMDKTAIAVFSVDSSSVEIVDYAKSGPFATEYTLKRGQLVILLAPPEVDVAGMAGPPSVWERDNRIIVLSDDDNGKTEYKPTRKRILESLAKRQKLDPQKIIGLYEKHRDDFTFKIEKIKDETQPGRNFPLVGPAAARHILYKCTICFTEDIKASWPIPYSAKDKCEDVVYLAVDHLHPSERLGDSRNDTDANARLRSVLQAYAKSPTESEPPAAQYRDDLKRLNARAEFTSLKIKETQGLIERIKKDPKAAGNGSVGITSIEAQQTLLKELEQGLAGIHADRQFIERQLLSYLSVLEERCKVAAKRKDVAREKVNTIEQLVGKRAASEPELAKAELEFDEAKLKLTEALRLKSSYQSVADELKVLVNPPSGIEQIQYFPNSQQLQNQIQSVQSYNSSAPDSHMLDAPADGVPDAKQPTAKDN